MAQLSGKLNTFKKALDSLNAAINTWRSLQEADVGTKLMARDSLVQRFEYTTDLFWKVVKTYLQEESNIVLESVSPSGIIRSAVHEKLFSELDGMACIEMIKSRNITSHVYHEETAQVIAQKIPEYGELMQRLTTRIISRARDGEYI